MSLSYIETRDVVFPVTSEPRMLPYSSQCRLEQGLKPALAH